MTASDYPLVLDTITALATLAVPIVVAVMAGRFNTQLKKWEASQWRNQELIKARLEYYRELVPRLNDLMCYLTFIGSWKEHTPTAVVQSKRVLDRTFYCAAPLFSAEVQEAYSAFMADCFEIYGAWGDDARLRTGFGRRREVAGAAWDESWEKLFSYPIAQPIPPESIAGIRNSYNRLISAFARDVELNAPRDGYVHDHTHTDAN